MQDGRTKASYRRVTSYRDMRCLYFQVVLARGRRGHSVSALHSLLFGIHRMRIALWKEESLGEALMCWLRRHPEALCRNESITALRRDVSPSLRKGSQSRGVSSWRFHYILCKPYCPGLHKSLSVLVPCYESILCLRIISSIRFLNINILQSVNTIAFGTSI